VYGSLCPTYRSTNFFGVFGVSFLTCLAATFLTAGTQSHRVKRSGWIIAFVIILLTPYVLKNKTWSSISPEPISVGVIQANLSMRDKWDESLFWALLDKYKHGIDHLIGNKQLIVMPESAIPLPAHYISDVLNEIHETAKRADSAILFGIPQPTSQDETSYYNTISSLGTAEGSYLKQQLVPFGEFIPSPLARMMEGLSIPIANLKPGLNNQPLIRVQNYPIATLICYELAYPQLLRKQLPRAEWIVSISDDGWFGHSLAMYQHLQMAQALSMLTGRFQIVANNDGLSSIIDAQGNITNSLPAFRSGILEGTIHSATGSSPWIYLGDFPVLFLSLFVFLYGIWKQRRAQRN